MPTLVTQAVAAKNLNVTVGMIQYWIGIGALKKYPRPRQLNGPKSEYLLQYLGENCNRNILVDLDVATLLIRKNAIERLQRENPEANLLTTREIAQRINRSQRTVETYIRKFRLKKYFLHSRSSNYLLDGEELADKMEAAGLSIT